MPELNFDDLRAAVETETFLPEFTEVRRRARRFRRRRALFNVVRVLGVLIVAAPAIAVGGIILNHLYSPVGVTVANATSGPQVVTTTSINASQAVTRAVVAVGGIDLEHTYALVEVCDSTGCDLELSQYAPSTLRAEPQQTSLLRHQRGDRVDDTRVSVLNASTVTVSAQVNRQPRQSVTVDVNPSTAGVSAGVRAVQDELQGPIGSIRGNSANETLLANQPPVTTPVLASQNAGWWVCGIDPSGQLAVSVSRNAGLSWSTHSIAVVPDTSTPDGSAGAALAVASSTDAYVLIETTSKYSLFASHDGGVTWEQAMVGQQWPAADSVTSYGLVTTAAGNLIAWFYHGGSKTTFLTGSPTDKQLTPLTGAAAPSGPVVAVNGGGYVTLGENPSISLDGVNWQEAYVPYE